MRDNDLLTLRHHNADLAALRLLLDDWARRGWLRELDRAFADFLSQEAPDASPLLILAAALASHQLGRGHVCLALDATLADAGFALSLPPEGDAGGEAPLLPGVLLEGLDLPGWLSALRHPLLVSDGAGLTPLVLVGSRLYLRRYWQYEQQVQRAIARRLRPLDSASLPRDAMAASQTASQTAAGCDRRSTLQPGPLRAMLDVLFPPQPDAAPLIPVAPANWQKLACALMANQGFGIVTGGPGTGKTTTVVKLLALLQSLALNTAEGGNVHALRIRLAAPTGKAAARLNESIARAVAQLPLDGIAQAEAVRAAIPTEVTTLHRLLGSRPDTRHFLHNARQPLALDVLVIDEASMVDLEMMAAVLDALPPSAQLVLLGDKDQLASVEAGAVLGELCRHAREGRYTRDTSDWLEAVTGETVAPTLRSEAGGALDQAVAMLRQSHRFSADSGIGQLAEAVNAGSVADTRAVWTHGYSDLTRVCLSDRGDDVLKRLVIDGAPARFNMAGRDDVFHGASVDDPAAPVGYRHYLQVMHAGPASSVAPPLHAWNQWARNVLAAHARFQVLSALRRGDYGVEGLNRRIAEILSAAGWIAANQLWYAGRPVLVTRNDYSLGLMNGDIGIALSVPVSMMASPDNVASRTAERSAAVDALAPARSDGSGLPAMTLRVAFPSSDARADGHGIRWVLPSRLQAVETVFAMTVHKSQGSEFEHAALVLPDRLNPILTRELVYTGITRARKWFTLASAGRDHRVFEEALSRRVLRASGLLED